MCLCQGGGLWSSTNSPGHKKERLLHHILMPCFFLTYEAVASSCLLQTALHPAERNCNCWSFEAYEPNKKNHFICSHQKGNIMLISWSWKGNPRGLHWCLLSGVSFIISTIKLFGCTNYLERPQTFVFDCTCGMSQLEPSGVCSWKWEAAVRSSLGLRSPHFKTLCPQLPCS